MACSSRRASPCLRLRASAIARRGQRPNYPRVAERSARTDRLLAGSAFSLAVYAAVSFSARRSSRRVNPSRPAPSCRLFIDFWQADMSTSRPFANRGTAWSRRPRSPAARGHQLEEHFAIRFDGEAQPSHRCQRREHPPDGTRSERLKQRLQAPPRPYLSVHAALVRPAREAPRGSPA